MKRIIAVMTAAALMGLCGCGTDTESVDENTSRRSVASAADSFADEKEESDENSRDFPAAESTAKNKSDDSGEDTDENKLVIDLSDTEKPQVQSVEVEYTEGIKGEWDSLRNLYGVHVLHSEVLGLLGCPVELDADDLTKGIITFNCAETVNMDILAMLWYDEDNDKYCYVSGFETDKDERTVSAEIDRDGVYLLVNNGEWGRMMGVESLDDVKKLNEESVMSFDEFGAEMTIPAGFLYEKSTDPANEYNGITVRELYDITERNLGWLDLYCVYIENTDGKTFDETVEEDIEYYRSNGDYASYFVTVLEDSVLYSIDDSHKGCIMLLKTINDSSESVSYDMVAYYQVSENSYICFQYIFDNLTQENADLLMGSLKSFKYVK